jgi:hypothetical protein
MLQGNKTAGYVKNDMGFANPKCSKNVPMEGLQQNSSYKRQSEKAKSNRGGFLHLLM